MILGDFMSLKKYIGNFLDYIDAQNQKDYLRKYDNYSFIATYRDNYGNLVVKENIMHDEIIEIMSKYVQGVRPIECGWTPSGAYYFIYEYIDIIDDKTPRMISRYITNDLISKYSRIYIPPMGMNSYVLCDAITYARNNMIVYYFKGTNLAGAEIEEMRKKLKL